MESLEKKFSTLVQLKYIKKKNTKISKRIFTLFLIFFVVALSPDFIFSQNQQTTPKLRIKIWSLLEPDPELQVQIKDSDSIFSYSVRELKNLAPYIFEGMIFGFNFSYTPSDKTRNVNEYFYVNFERQNYLTEQDFKKNISYHNAYVQDNKLICWAEFNLTHGLDKQLERKSSVVMPKIHGKGIGKLSDGEKGIKQAFELAIKNAVREYTRTITKNKPKEINGTVLIKNTPRVYIQNGKYHVDLDFFLEYVTIIDYKIF